MYCVKQITDDLYWIGGSDRRLSRFENIFPLPHGISYNSYLLMDEKTVLLDTVDHAISKQFFENLEHVLNGRKLDYLIVTHMEPDHCATMNEVVRCHPEVKIIGNTKTITLIKQFFDFDIDSRAVIVNEMNTLSVGKHTLTFIMAPMVHWPEVMVVYDSTSKTLFSADAFGTFGAINGNLFADEIDFEKDWLDEARRYYSNIVGKYGTQVQSLLRKVSKLEINLLCPIHGPVWRSNIDYFIDKYKKWSTYTPEDEAVMIAYGSIYGNTECAANILAGKLAELGVKNIAIYDVSGVHPSYIVSEAFRCSHLVFLSSTYNAGIFLNMETALIDIKEHNLQNRTVAIIENGSWAPSSGSLMRNIISSMKNMKILDPTLTIKSSLKEDQLEQLDTIAKAIVDSMKKPKPETNALFKINYGLYVLTAKEGSKDNACIINTVTQLTDTPTTTIAIAINKANYTHDMILHTGKFNLSVLTTETPFKLFKNFGFQSGRETDKFEGFQDMKRSSNGLYYITKYTNAFISGKVISSTDCGTHTLFIAEVTESQVLTEVPSVTYSYYLSNIKPAPDPIPAGVKGFICKICGYIYEGDTLPKDFICPICKHGAEDFERIG